MGYFFRKPARMSAANKIRYSGANGVPAETDLSAFVRGTLNSADAGAFRTAIGAAESGASSAHNDLSSIQGGASGEYYHLTSAQHTAVGSMVTSGLSDLTSAEVDQLENIGSTTLSAAQWGYLGSSDQGISKTDDVTFNKVEVSQAPTLPAHAVRKDYVDNLIDGLKFKEPARVATTGSVNISTDLENGKTIDGVTLATGDRVLVKNQALAQGGQHGVYVVAASGAASRATDFNAAAEFASATLAVSEGTTNADTEWVCSNNDPITLGTTVITFVQRASVSNHANLSGLQGGSAGQYNHIDNAQLTALQALITAGVDDLTSAEVNQLKNIGVNNISAAIWGYVAGLNQGLSKTSDVEFKTVKSDRNRYGVTRNTSVNSTLSLSATTKQLVYLTPVLANRDVKLPATPQEGDVYEITNESSQYSLQLQDSSGSNIGTGSDGVVSASQYVKVEYVNSTWYLKA